jgi:hypothetical protein|tara:strand:+ start:363 stop:656 length:294 start_codon:yes stop_codon:yes gene_type:complete
MLEIIFGALFASAAILFLVFKFGNIRHVLAFDILIDTGATLFLSFVLFGTFSGMMVALVTGAIISFILFVMKRTIGYDILTRKGWKTGPRPMDGVMR